MDPTAPPSSGRELRARRRRSWLKLSLGLLALLALNIAAFWSFGLPSVQDFLRNLEGSVFFGSFVLAFITNFTVAVPIPYNPIIFQMMQATAMPWLVAITTAAGATLGETSGFLAGRAGRGSFQGTRFAEWTARQLQHPKRAFWLLFLVSAPPFPAFDVAGLVAGAVGVSARVFYPAVFLGRLARFMLFAAAATWMFGQ